MNSARTVMENTLQRMRFSAGFELFRRDEGHRISLPFGRSVPAILIVSAMAIGMTIPAISVFGQAAADWGRLDDLFDLVGALFSTGWLMGWSVGLFALYTVAAVLIAGRETLILAPGRVEIRLGLPVLFLRVILDPGRIDNLRHEIPPAKGGKAWRGPHLAFDYDGAPLEVGSNLDEYAAMQLAARIRELPAATGAPERPEISTATPGTTATTADNPQGETRTRGTTLSMLALVAANLLPIAGVLMFGWDLGAIMVLFWAESGIIGVYHLLGLAMTRRWLALLLGPVFVGHFGAFMAVHFLFLYGFFIEGLSGDGPGDSLAEVAQVFVVLWPALLALAVSHGISFVTRFPGRNENRQVSLGDEMSAPYRRIAIMHVTLILGGAVSLMLGTPLVALVLLIALKTVVDLNAHRAQRSRHGNT